MPLYLVNARTNQDCRFFYRLPEQQQATPYYIDIPMGGQRPLPEPHGGLSEVAISNIVDDNYKYGMREAGTGLERGRYVTMLWSRKPITEKHILQAIEHNQQVIRQRTAGRLEATAMQIADSIDEGLHRSQMPDRLRALEATVQERGENSDVDQAVRVQRTPPEREQGDYRRRNSRRKA